MPLGLVAQSVEQRIENPCVGGSIPPRATKNIKDLASARSFLFGRTKKGSRKVGIFADGEGTPCSPINLPLERGTPQMQLRRSLSNYLCQCRIGKFDGPKKPRIPPKEFGRFVYFL